MRDIPVDLQTHIAAEVTTLTRCIKITKQDGTILRLTTHDQDILFSGDTYSHGVPIELSALQSSDSLTVDNAEITLGIDGTLVTQTDLDSGVYDNALFDLFIVNWEDPGAGAIYLKKGTLGDIDIVNNVTATIQLRGLTQSLQRPIVERYSPTCRVNLGGAKCGVVNSPVRIRRPNQKVKTYDWFLVPAANTTTVVVGNPSFESAGIEDAGWVIPDGSAWSRQNDFVAHAGTYYAEAGSGSLGQEHVLVQDFHTLADLGMADSDVDAGKFTFDVNCQVARTSEAILNPGKVYIEQYDDLGKTLRRDELPYAVYDYQAWQGIGITAFIVPGVRVIRVGLVSRIDAGSAGHVAFDEVNCRYWLNQADTWNGAAFRTVKLPSDNADEKIAITNNSFETALVANTSSAGAVSGWTLNGWFQVVGSLGSLSPSNGSKFLTGGNNGTGTPAQVYECSRTLTLSADALGATAKDQDITDGWWVGDLRVDVGRSDSDSAPRVVLEFLDAGTTVLGSVDTGYLTGGALTTNVMLTKRLLSRLPAGTKKIKIRLFAKSGAAGSTANAAFDNVQLFFYPVAYEHDNDPELAYLATTQPTYDYDQQDFTIDGEAIVQSRPLIFGYSTVTSTIDKRSFVATGIAKTAALMYSGRITWLSGDNAGKVSFVRIWDPATHTAKLYEQLPFDVQVGDKFVFAEGCDKTLDRCFALGNVHNMRAEPYLPGPTKVISFVTASQSSA